MKTEIEVKFCDIDIDATREILARAGAVCEQPLRLMRRVIIETEQLAERHAFVRVRDEGHRTTLTYKQFDEASLTGAKEIEVTVSDFDATVALLEQVDLVHKSFQESRRETWKLGDVEVVIDEWPHLNAYIEIEGGSEASVKKAAETLGFVWSDAIFGSVTEVYQHQYPNGQSRELVNMSRISFDEPLPAIISGIGVSHGA
jgi:adenylate cyclase class 2